MTRIAYLSGSIDASLKSYLESIPLLHADELHAKVLFDLKAMGYQVKRDYLIQNRGDGRRGKLDVLATRDDEVIALELDHATPRRKSILKVNNCPNATARIIVCRY